MSSPDEIFEYLPISYKTQDEENYVSFLWESFDLNYQNGKYQFAFIAYHLLFMTYVYFQLWKIYAADPQLFRKSTLGLHKIREVFESLEDINEKNVKDGDPLAEFYPFSFSEENESTIMHLFHLIGCHKSKIGNYKKLIKDRNEIAHANGKLVFVSSQDIDNKIDEILRLIDEIHTHTTQTVETCLVQFLTTSADPDEREYIDNVDQINEVLIKGNYISPKNLEELARYPIDSHLYENKYDEVRSLHDALIGIQSSYSTN